MARCSPLGKATATAMEVENIDEAAVVAKLERAFGKNLTTSDGKERVVSPCGEDILSEGVSNNEKSCTYYFGSSTITVGNIKEIEEKGYFAEDVTCVPGPETVPEPNEMKLWCTRIFLLPACVCLRIRLWLIFCCISRLNCIS
jgi:hypothetical protein